MDAAFPVRKRASAGRWLALLLLAAANLGLFLIFFGRFTALADVIAPLTGHLMGLGFAASLAVLFPRRRLALLAAGAAVTIGLHGWLGLARCCEPPCSRVPCCCMKLDSPCNVVPCCCMSVGSSPCRDVPWSRISLVFAP